MIERGIVEASTYTHSRVLSPTLHTSDVHDFVELRYSDEKPAKLSSSDSQTQAESSDMSLGCDAQNGSSSAEWKTVEESLISSPTDADGLTFIPCESGSLVTATDENEIVLSDKSQLSSGDAVVKYGDESPGVHSSRSTTRILPSDAVTVHASLSKPAADGNSSTDELCGVGEKTSGSEVGCSTTPVSDYRADGIVSTSASTDSETNRSSTQSKTRSHGMIM